MARLSFGLQVEYSWLSFPVLPFRSICCGSPLVYGYSAEVLRSPIPAEGEVRQTYNCSSCRDFGAPDDSWALLLTEEGEGVSSDPLIYWLRLSGADLLDAHMEALSVLDVLSAISQELVGLEQGTGESAQAARRWFAKGYHLVMDKYEGLTIS